MKLAATLEPAAFALLLLTLGLSVSGMGGALAWSLALGRVGMTLCLLLCAAAALGRGRPLLFARRPHRALGIYLGLAGVSALASPYAYGSWQAALTTSVYAATFVAASYLFTAARRRVFISFVFWLTGLLCVYGLLQALGLGATPRYLESRVSSLFFNSNHFGGFLVLALPLCLSFALFSERPGTRGLAGALAGLAALNLVLSFSWGVVAALPPLTTLLLRSEKVKGRAVLLLTGSGLSVLVLALPFVSGSPTLTTLSTSVSSRLALAQGSLRLIRDAPLLGVGPGNYVYAVTRYRPPTSDTRPDLLLHQRLNYAHNDFLQVASETGVPSLLAFLAFWALVLLGPSGLPKEELWGFKGGLVALLLYGVSDGNLTVIPANALLAYSFAGALLGPKG